MHLLEVAIGGLLQVVFVKEEISVLGAVGLRLQEINGLQPEALGHLQDRFMAGGRRLSPPPPRLSFFPTLGVWAPRPPPARRKPQKTQTKTRTPLRPRRPSIP